MVVFRADMRVVVCVPSVIREHNNMPDSGGGFIAFLIALVCAPTATILFCIIGAWISTHSHSKTMMQVQDRNDYESKSNQSGESDIHT